MQAPVAGVARRGVGFLSVAHKGAVPHVPGCMALAPRRRKSGDVCLFTQVRGLGMPLRPCTRELARRSLVLLSLIHI